jgi:hypothetical protein
VSAIDYDEFLSDVATTIATHLGAHERTPSARPRAVTGSQRALPDLFLLDHEKVVWHFPDVSARIVEEVP